MNELRYTLVGDGTSDRRLLPILNWLLQSHSSLAISATWADVSVFPSPPKTLTAKVADTVEFYPCDILFVHRDAETAPRQQRLQEIRSASVTLHGLPVVPVVPVRMQEAWLLINEQAIRTAAGRPNGREPLGLPSRKKLEKHPNPKQALYQALQTARGMTGRHLARFNVAAATYRVSELITDYSPLRGLSAFDALEHDLVGTLKENGLT